MESVSTVPLLIIDDFGMRKLPLTAAEDLLEIIMRRYERCSTLLTSNRPVEVSRCTGNVDFGIVRRFTALES
jgi:DNA replication protein DnaC